MPVKHDTLLHQSHFVVLILLNLVDSHKCDIFKFLDLLCNLRYSKD